MLEIHSEFVFAAIRTIELIGVAIIAAGAFFTLAQFAVRVAGRQGTLDALHRFRGNFGQAILLGLEFLVAADIINTITVELSVESVTSLAVLILLRTFLSFTLEMEIEGRWPWQRGARREDA
jgi:uncharacterized membrane protein